MNIVQYSDFKLNMPQVQLCVVIAQEIRLYFNEKFVQQTFCMYYVNVVAVSLKIKIFLL